jgi:hypothetical protein
MSYQTGTSTGPNDLIDKIRAFLESDGWTTNLFTTVGLGYRLHVQKTAADGTVMYFNFRSAIAEHGSTITGDNRDYQPETYNYGDITGILINGSTGYDVGLSWDMQPDYPRSLDDPYPDTNSMASCMTAMSTSAIPAYYIFSVDDTVNIVVEVTSGEFQFMSFGLLEKQGVYTGGQFFSASYDSYEPNYERQYIYSTNIPNYFSANTHGESHGAVYVDADSVASFRRAAGAQLPEIKFPCVTSGHYSSPTNTQCGFASFFWAKAPNYYNNIAAMCPIYTTLKRSDNKYSLLGWPSGVRFLNVLNYSAGQEVTYGSETWKIFPENSIPNYETNVQNRNCGFAFKKVV